MCESEEETSCGEAEDVEAAELCCVGCLAVD